MVPLIFSASVVKFFNLKPKVRWLRSYRCNIFVKYIYSALFRLYKQRILSGKYIRSLKKYFVNESIYLNKNIIISLAFLKQKLLHTQINSSQINSYYKLIFHSAYLNAIIRQKLLKYTIKLRNEQNISKELCLHSSGTKKTSSHFKEKTIFNWRF